MFMIIPYCTLFHRTSGVTIPGYYIISDDSTTSNYKLVFCHMDLSITDPGLQSNLATLITSEYIPEEIQFEAVKTTGTLSFSFDGSAGKVIFDGLVINEGGWNTTEDGGFIVPAAGRYRFDLSCTPNKWVAFEVLVNEALMQIHEDGYYSGEYARMASVSFGLTLKEGDVVRLSAINRHSNHGTTIFISETSPLTLYGRLVARGEEICVGESCAFVKD